MLVGIISFIGKAIIVICILGALLFKYTANDCRKHPSPQALIKERLKTETFQKAIAQYIELESYYFGKQMGCEHLEYIDYAMYHGKLIPYVDYSGHINEGQRDEFQIGMVAKYRLVIDNEEYFLFSKKCTLPTLTVYYNVNDPKEIYHEKEIEKVNNWTETKERIYRKQEENEMLDIAKVFLAIAGVVLLLFIVF